MEMYCVKCKEKTATDGVTPIVMKNGRDAIQGVCAVCGTKKFRIGKMPAGQAA